MLSLFYYSYNHPTPYIYLILILVFTKWWPNKWYHLLEEGVAFVFHWFQSQTCYLNRFLAKILVLSCLFLGCYHIFHYKLVLQIKTNKKVPNFYPKNTIWVLVLVFEILCSFEKVYKVFNFLKDLIILYLKVQESWNKNEFLVSFLWKQIFALVSQSSP